MKLEINLDTCSLEELNNALAKIQKEQGERSKREKEVAIEEFKAAFLKLKNLNVLIEYETYDDYCVHLEHWDDFDFD